MLKVFGLILVLLLAASINALAADLTGRQIRDALTGNSITSPDFGCVFYSRYGKTVATDGAGNFSAGEWSIEGDLYFSSGSCGTKGCTLSGDFPDLVFQRIDGRYAQPATVINGNFCEKNVIIS